MIAQAEEWERQSEYRRAVDCWMRVDGLSQDQQMVGQSLSKVKFINLGNSSRDGAPLFSFFFGVPSGSVITQLL